MRLPARLTRNAALVCLPIFAVGCVPQDRYDNLLTANRSLREQAATLETDRDQARADLGAVQMQLAESRSQYHALQMQYGDLRGTVDGMDSLNSDYLSRIAALELGPLPVEIATAIERLAIAHPELVTFDPNVGMLRFASDFTFDLGSVEVKSDAAETMTVLANLLNDPAAMALEVRVVGHTDNVPIGKPDTRRNHPNNTYLSVHRAIAVRDVLTAAGVDPVRVQVAGYGEYRPIVVNSPKRGAAANRRVEIYLAPMSEFQMAMPSAGSAPDQPAPAPAAASAEPNK